MDRREFLKGIGAGLAGAFVATGSEAKDKLLDEADHILDHDLGYDEEERWRKEYYRVCGKPADGRNYPSGEIYDRGPMHNACRMGHPDDTVMIVVDDSPLTATEILQRQEKARERWREGFRKACERTGWEMDEALLKAFSGG